MSFNDLERGLEQRAPLARSGAFADDPRVDGQFRKLSSKVATHVFRINSNVSGIQKLLDLIGTSRDTPAIRSKLHDLTEATREFIKQSSNDAKELASWKIVEHQTQHRVEQQKVSREYAAAIQSFQKVSRQSAERQKLFVERAKHAATAIPSSSATHKGGLPDEVELSETSSSPRLRASDSRQNGSERQRLLPQDQPQQQQQQQQQTLERNDGVVADAELDYQEALIEQREAEIREIETGIHELNEIFRDLGTIVTEQGGLIDNIESNVHSVQRDTHSAVEELTHAHEYQRKAGKRMMCLLLIFCIVLAVVLIAVLA